MWTQWSAPSFISTAVDEMICYCKHDPFESDPEDIQMVDLAHFNPEQRSTRLFPQEVWSMDVCICSLCWSSAEGSTSNLCRLHFSDSTYQLLTFFRQAVLTEQSSLAWLPPHIDNPLDKSLLPLKGPNHLQLPAALKFGMKI